MQPRRRATVFKIVPALLVVLFCAVTAHGASLRTFAVVFGQVTNEIATIQANFDNSTAQKQKLAKLVRARGVILDPELRDDEALKSLVDLLGSNSDYDSTLDETASNARASVIDDYHLLGLRVADLPPSLKTTRARNRFDELANDAATLEIAQHAAGVSAQLAPFGRRLDSIRETVERATKMPVPGTRLNSVRAQINGHRFVSAGEAAHSPNQFEVTAPNALYREVSCRVVDGPGVITFSLPVITEQVRYEIAQGLAGLAYTENVFATDPVTVSATEGIFFVQRDRNEIYGVFSAAGPGFEVKDGRFRIRLPRTLRGD